MTHSFAIGYDWLYAALSPAERAWIRRAIVEKGLDAAIPIYRAKRSWTQVRHNWNQVCNGGIGIGALAVAEDEPDKADFILRNALESIRIPMAEYGPDGGWGEGPGYCIMPPVITSIFWPPSRQLLHRTSSCRKSADSPAPVTSAFTSAGHRVRLSTTRMPAPQSAAPRKCSGWRAASARRSIPAPAAASEPDRRGRARPGVVSPSSPHAQGIQLASERSIPGSRGGLPAERLG